MRKTTVSYFFWGLLSGRRTIRICIARLQDKIFKRKFYLGIFFLLLWLWAANCQTLSWTFLSMLLTKVFERIQKNTMKAKKWGKLQFHNFFWGFWVEDVQLEYALHVSSTKYSKKSFIWEFFSCFSDFERQIVSLWAKLS